MDSREPPPIQERAWEGGGSNTLVLAPAFSGDEDDLCTSLLTGTPPAETNQLWVTFSDDVATRLAAWDEREGSRPADLGIVEVGGGTGERAVPETDGVETMHVSRPGDLTGAGVRLSELLGHLEGSDARIAACFYGLTVPLQYVDHGRLYRFLEVVVERMREVDAVAHYHMDPNVVDDERLRTLRSLFDTVVEHEDGEWRLRETGED